MSSDPTTTAAGRPRKAADSARWCERCQKWGDHHTDRHDECAPATAALTTNAPCAVLLVPPITTGGLLRLTSLTVKVSDDEMWGRLNG